MVAMLVSESVCPEIFGGIDGGDWICAALSRFFGGIACLLLIGGFLSVSFLKFNFSIRKLRLNGENVISMVEDGKIYIEEPEENIELAVTFGDNSVKNGDVNGNGFIEKEDAVLLMRHIVNDKSEPIFEYASDMNDDDVINVTDVLLIIIETNK